MIVGQYANMRNAPHATRHPAFLDIDQGPAQAQAILKDQIAREAGAEASVS